MKLKKEFIVHTAGNEAVLVPAGSADFHGIVRGNRTLGSILELLQKEITEEEIISSMKALYSAPEGAVEKDVKKALSELRRIGALDE